MNINNKLQFIPISQSFKNYVERFVYLKNRYTKFLNLINNSNWKQYMTEEEFDSSYKYYVDKYNESQSNFKLIMQSIKEIYNDKIKNRPFDIDFVDNCIVIDTSNEKINVSGFIENKHKNYFEQFSDFIHRIYDGNVVLDINGSHVMNITMQVTDDCNMKCTYCYQHNKGKHKMSYVTATKFIDMILDGGKKTENYMDSNKMSGVILDFIGGEPFMEVDLIDRVCDYFLAQLFKRKHHWVEKFMFSFSSNGLLYFDEGVQNYIKKYSNFVSLGISIDGNKELHDACRVDLEGNGTYDRAVEAAKDLMNRYGGDSTKMTISPYNVHLVHNAVINMIELGYHMIHLNCVYEEGWTNNHAVILYHQLIKIVDYLDTNNLMNDVDISMFNSMHCKPMNPSDNKNWCGGTGLMMAVDYKGDIYPCLRYMESSVGNRQSPYIIGNIRDGICNKQEHIDRIECMKCITRKSQSTEECFNCSIASGCGWCSAYNYECYGTPNKRAIFICCMHKARSLANAYYLAKRYGSSTIYCPEEWAIPIIGKEEYDKLVEFCKGGK